VSKSDQRLWAKLTAIARGLGQPCGLRWLALGCILASLLVMPNAARAVTKSYPGANCVFAEKGTDWSLNRGGLFNRNSASRPLARVDCPVIKDRPGAVIRSGTVFVIDGNPQQNVSCELVGVEGTNERLGPVTASSGSRTTPEQLELDPFNPPSFGTIWFIGCFLPSGAGILVYEFDQQ
jgi:hypothetical protein